MMVIIMGCMFTAEAQCIHKAGIRERRDSCMQSLDKDPFSPTMQMEAVHLTGKLYEPCPICDGGSSTGTIYPPLPGPNGLNLPINTNKNGGFTTRGNGRYNNKNGDMTNYIGSYSRKTSSSQWDEIILGIVVGIGYALCESQKQESGQAYGFCERIGRLQQSIYGFFREYLEKNKGKLLVGKAYC